MYINRNLLHKLIYTWKSLEQILYIDWSTTHWRTWPSSDTITSVIEVVSTIHYVSYDIIIIIIVIIALFEINIYKFIEWVWFFRFRTI